MKIPEEIEQATLRLERLLAALNERILSLPDNPHLRRLPGSGNAFLIRSKDLGNNWTVEHHCFRFQYEAVVARLSESPADAIKKLRLIIAEGKVRAWKGSSQAIALHPDVKGHLQGLLDKEVEP
jgi:hypothetical protein